MSENNSLKQVLDIFKEISHRHNQIKAYGQGDIWELQAIKRNYPLLWVDLENAVFERDTVDLNMICYVMDLASEKNELNVQSQMLYIARDIQLMLIDEYELIEEDTTQVTPFTENFDDSVSGVFFQFQVKLSYTYGECDIPKDAMDIIIPPLCEPVKIFNSEENLITTVNSGDNYIINDNEYVDTDGVLKTSVYGDLIICSEIKDIFIKAIFSEGNNEMDTLVIDSDNAGEYLNIETLNTGDVLFSINNSDFEPFEFWVPLTLNIGDELIIQRELIDENGFVKLIGNYE
jgi:hypothetical protein